jgi:hypothetical protein
MNRAYFRDVGLDTRLAPKPAACTLDPIAIGAVPPHGGRGGPCKNGDAELAP